MEDSREGKSSHPSQHLPVSLAASYREIPITRGMIPKESSNAGCSYAKMVKPGCRKSPRGSSKMQLKYVLALMLLVGVAQAKEPRHYQSGKLLRMESIKCGTDEKNGKSFAGEMIGTESAHMKTRELLCQQYVLETDSLVYSIRPKEEKHPVLLPIGEKAQFRLDKDKMLLKVEDSDNKERVYIVLSIFPKDASNRGRE